MRCDTIFLFVNGVSEVADSSRLAVGSLSALGMLSEKHGGSESSLIPNHSVEARHNCEAGVEVRSYGERPPNVCEAEQLSEEDWKQTLGRSG